MTAVFLQNELQSIISESKRKTPETRAAAEKSLADLKSLSITSETQLSGDLVRKPHFIDPFILSCRSRNVKLATPAINCLQRLANGRAIPRERLSDVLDALREIASLSVDIQLKILQTLPALLSSDIKGPLLAVALEVCDTLQTSKTTVISSTAEATFQQLVTTIYERVTSEDAQPSQQELLSVPAGKENIAVGPAAYDAYRVFADLCALANAEQPTFVQLKTPSSPFLLEVVGGIASNYGSILAQHPEQLEVCRSSLVPALNKAIAAKSAFPIVVRALRTLYLLLRQHVRDMVLEFEQGLGSMIALLEPNVSHPWRRVVAMEVFRGIFSDASLFRDLYRLYDDAEGRENIVENLLATFVRIASEDPALIGLGRQSTMPFQHGEATNGNSVASFETSDIGGAVGAVVSAGTTVTGISNDWSTVKMPLLEQLDKSNPSDIPTTYVYGLVLNCMSALAEGLSRFVMPLSVPSKIYSQRTEHATLDGVEVSGQKVRQLPKRSNTSTQTQNRLLNPLTLKDHPQIESISSCARMIDNCWPPVLATCSTFFNAALDAEYYHNLVRAVQKLTQISGILEISTARDALLTTLSKAAIPPSTGSRLFSPSGKQNTATEEASGNDGSTMQTPQSATPRDFGQPRLSVRNLLCLRALLNLGIALGASLGTDAWYIILESLKRAEVLLLTTKTVPGGDVVETEERPTEQGGTRTLFGVEITAVQTATKRMFESTSSYTDEAFTLLATSLFKLGPQHGFTVSSNTGASLTSPTSTPSRARMHTTTRSTSVPWISHDLQDDDHEFVISKINDLARTNMHRFLSPESPACSWYFLIRHLLQVFGSQQARIANRLKSSSEINSIVVEAVKSIENYREDTNLSTALLKHCFEALQGQLEIIQNDTTPSDAGASLRRECHANLIGTLEIILGHCGDALTEDWTNVLSLISSVFVHDDAERGRNKGQSSMDLEVMKEIVRSEAILQRAFACLQLIVSDFLGTLRSADLNQLTMLIYSFGAQDTDLNISLTATTFFWNVSTLLLDISGSNQDGSDRKVSNEKPITTEARKAFSLLFSCISRLSLDSRLDVRQSSTRMTTKVLEASSDHLSSMELNMSVSRLLELCERQLTNHTESVNETTSSWLEAAEQTLVGITEISIQNTCKILGTIPFDDNWAKYAQVCSSLLIQGSLGASCTVYKGFAAMLQSLEADQDGRHLQRTNSVLEICLSHHPADIQTGRDSNQAAMSQFIATLTIILNMGPDLKVDHSQVILAVKRSVLECVHPPYTSDTKALAVEQVAVVAIFPLLERLLSNSAYTSLLQSFMEAPLAPAAVRTNATCVALSARCSEILRDVMTAQLEDNSDPTPDVVPMLEALSNLISTKYTALPQGGTPPLWRNATVTAVQISQAAMKSAACIQDIPRLTIAFIQLTTSILQAGGLPISAPQTPELTADEAFDISSFAKLHAAIIPAVDNHPRIIPPTLLKSYALILFHASLVAQPLFGDLPSDMLKAPLETFAKLRPGTVRDPVFTPRNAICHTALDALFGLVARKSTGTPNTESPAEGRSEKGSGGAQTPRLDQAAAPYLLLRCAHTFKTFLADQPLRSISALPSPLQTELLTVLNKCIELRCEVETFMGITAKDGNGSSRSEANDDGKAHLRLLNGLFVQVESLWRRLPRKATGVNWQDRRVGKEVEEAMARWRACLAEGWEVIL